MLCRRLCVALSLPVAVALGQCQPDWGIDFGLPGVDGLVRTSLRWDPDGPGPRPEWIVLGGRFTYAGRKQVRNLAAWDPQAGVLHDLAGGCNGEVHALARLATGELVVAGDFTFAGSIPARSIAITNGQTWSPLGLGVDGTVLAVAVRSNGDLVAGGAFPTAGGIAANNVAIWSGGSWSTINAPNFGVRAIAEDATGGLLLASSTISRWDGISLQSLGTPPLFLSIHAILIASNGNVVVCGQHSGAMVSNVAMWNGSTWTQLGTAVQVVPRALQELPNGDILVAGTRQVTVNSIPIARWNGTAWTTVATIRSGLTPPLEEGLHTLCSLANGDLIAAGNFIAVEDVGAQSAAVLAGGTWRPLQTGIDGAVHVVRAVPNGQLYVGGNFLNFGGVGARHVAWFDGSSWQALGAGVNGPVKDLAVLPDGDLVVTGTFTAAGGSAAENVARWDGTTWHSLGAGLPFYFGEAIEVLPNGRIVVGGSGFGGTANLVEWDGNSWTTFGSGSGPASTVYDLMVMPNGNLVVAGIFGFVSGLPIANLALWNGQWSSFGGSFNGPVYDTHLDAQNNLIACGIFTSAPGTPATGIARWNGTAWSAFGASTFANAGTSLPNGDIVISAVIGADLLRWNGSSWTPLADIDGSYVSDVQFANGEVLVVGGHRVQRAGIESRYLTRLSTPCPAIVITAATGCASSGGSNLLQASGLWVGGTTTETGSGLPLAAFVLAARGVSVTSVPLGLLLPQGAPGCNLGVVPEQVELLSTSSGSASSSYTLPNNPGLVGLQLVSQWVPLEIGASLQIVTATSTNTVFQYVGSF
ncbi:MAG: hypothetical protein MUC36_03090 [Planctomycetes bacterium]|jgi:hypothetical protein|nr:hypothetical protein [Planctomycetota bacterium]